MKKVLSLVLAVVLTLVCAFTAVAEEPATIKIALINALSGDMAEGGQHELEAAQLAIKNINDAGGIKSLGGAKLELVSADYTSSTDNTKSVVERVLSSNDIVAGIGGTTSGLILPTLPVWEKYGIPLVTENNATDLTSQGYEYVFSVHCRATSCGEVSVDFVKSLQETYDIDASKCAIIYENSAKGMSSADGARATIEKAGMGIVYDDSHPNTITDVTPILTAVKSSGAAVNFIYTIEQVAKLLFTTSRDLEYYPMMITANQTPSFYDALGDAINGTLVACNWTYGNKNVVENPEFKAVTDAYEETYGYFMDQSAGGVYSSVMIIAEALEACGTTDGEILRDTIRAGSYETLLDGTVTFDEGGANNNASAVIAQWQDGELVAIYPEHLASGTYIDPSQL